MTATLEYLGAVI